MGTLIYIITKGILKVECFKMDNVDETTDFAYRILATNTESGESDFVTTNTPQGAIALADSIINGLN